jgi:hypothetical protein
VAPGRDEPDATAQMITWCTVGAAGKSRPVMNRVRSIGRGEQEAAGSTGNLGTGVGGAGIAARRSTVVALQAA